jgi:SAM-dependent methyltransferase
MNWLKRLLLTLYECAPWRALDRWLGYSEQRRMLDGALEAEREAFAGRVLEIGGERERRRRGHFVPPFEAAEAWWMLDLDRKRRPHIFGDALALPFPSGAFDVIMGIEVLDDLDDYFRALVEMQRVLKPEGTLILSVPFLQGAGPPDVWRFTEKGLRAALAKAGFACEVVHPEGAALLVAANALKRVIYLMPRGPVRILVAALAWLPISMLRWFDGPVARWLPGVCDEFSTGFLVRARAVPDSEGEAAADHG